MKHPLLCPLGFALCALASPFLLNGCTSTDTPVAVMTAQDWAELQHRLKTIQEIELRGRVNFKSAEGSMGAVFNYSHDNERTVLKLTSSFGKDIGTLKITKDQAELIAQNKKVTAPSARELFLQTVGIDLPLDTIHELILGIAQPNSIYNDDGSLLVSSLEPHFKIIYEKFMTYEDWNLPAVVTIQSPQNTVEIKTHRVLTLKTGAEQ